MISHIFSRTDPFYERLEALWKTDTTQRRLADVLVALFLFSLVAIQVRRWDLLPDRLATLVPTNHFVAVGLVFSTLLAFEIIGLVFVLPE